MRCRILKSYLLHRFRSQHELKHETATIAGLSNESLLQKNYKNIKCASFSTGIGERLTDPCVLSGPVIHLPPGKSPHSYYDRKHLPFPVPACNRKAFEWRLALHSGPTDHTYGEKDTAAWHARDTLERILRKGSHPGSSVF